MGDYQTQLIVLINASNPNLTLTAEKVNFGLPRKYTPPEGDNRNTEIDISARHGVSQYIGTKTYRYHRIEINTTHTVAKGVVTSGIASILSALNAAQFIPETLTADDVSIDTRWNAQTSSFSTATVSFAVNHLKYRGDIIVSEDPT